MGSALSFVVPPFTLTVGGVDFSPFVSQLSLQRPRVEIGTPYSWTGSITFVRLLNNTLLPESLDDFANPTRWDKAMHPVVFSVKGSPVCVVRIVEYHYNEGDEVEVGEAQVGDLLTIYDYRSPATDYKELGFAPNESVTINRLGEKVLSQAELPGSIDIPGELWVAPDKPDGAFLRFLQPYCGERGYGESVTEVKVETFNKEFQRSKVEKVKMYGPSRQSANFQVFAASYSP